MPLTETGGFRSIRVWSFLCFSIFAGVVHAYPDGISWASGYSSDCTGCHSGGSYNYTANLTAGSTVVERSTATTITFGVSYNSGSFAKDTGLNVASPNGGTLSESSALLQLMAGENGLNEITHVVPQPSNSLVVGGGNVGAGYTWPSFTWTSPNSSGTYTLYGCGNLVNGSRQNPLDGTGYTGDNPVCDTLNIAVNDAPVINASIGSAAHTEQIAVTVDNALSLTDTEGNNMSSATITISGNYSAASGDRLTLGSCPSGTSCSGSGTQTITISGSSLFGNYQTAFRSVQFNTTSDTPSTLTRTVQFSVTDTFSRIRSDTRTVTIAASNDPPVITQGASTGVVMSEDSSPTPFSLTLNATDPEGSTLTWSILTPASNGTATASGTGTSKAIGYIPTANYNGSDSFVVRVTDGSLTDDITVNVTINAVNDAPVIAEGASTGVVMSEDGSPTPFSLTLNASDTEGSTLTWSILTPAGNGTATASGTGTSKVIGYTPTANYNGSDSFVVRVTDGSLTDDITVNVTINAVNDAPVIAEGSSTGVVMSEDSSPTPFSLTLNASDIEGSTLTWSILSQGGNGTASASGTGMSKAIGYTPTANYNGSDSFVVRVTDGGLTDDITVNVTISSAADTPVITEGASIGVVMSEDSSPTPFSLTLNATDGDNDTLTWSILSAAGNGSASASGTGTSKVIGYTPNANYFGSDSFVVRVNDGGLTDDITVNVTIGSVNDVPAVSTNTGMTVLDGATTVIGNTQLGSTDNDTSDTPSILTYTLTAVPANGVLTLNGTQLFVSDSFAQSAINSGLVEYTDTSSSSSDSFTFNLKDDENAGPDGVTFNITISPNSPPVIAAGGTLSYTENQSPQIIDGGITVSDLEGNDITGATIQITGNYESGADVLSFTNQLGITVQSNTGDTLTLTGTATLADYQTVLRTVSYSSTSEDPSVAPRTVTFVVSDADNPSSGATSTINIARQNDVPTSADKTVNINEDTPRVLLAADFPFNDVDSSDSLQSVKITQLPAAGSLELSGTPVTVNQNIVPADLAGNLAFTPASNENGSPYATLQFTVSDGTVSSTPANTMTINVGADNDAPQATGGTVVLATVDEDAVLSGVSVAGGFTDAESNDLDYAVTSGSLPTGVSLDNANGDLTGAPPVPGNYSFSVTATETDGSPSNLSSAPQAFSWVVNEAVNDAPQAIGGTIALADANEDSALSGASVAGDFSDEDNNNLDYAVTAGSLPVGISLDAANGDLTGTPTVPGSYSFSITATETDGTSGNLSSLPQDYSLDILETVNDAPVVIGGTVTLPASVENSVLSGVTVTSAFSDEEGNALSYALTSGSFPVGVSLAATGGVTGTPTTSGVFAFGVTVTETNGSPSNLLSGEQAFSLTVSDINDAPSVTGGTITLPNATAGAAITGTSVVLGFSDEESNTLTYVLASGSLPMGVILNASTGAIEGTPLSWGLFSFSVVASETNGIPSNLSSAAQAFGLTVTIIDDDSDTVPNFLDNCPAFANVDQTNTDGDSEGDACDSDDDNDGMPDTFESDNGFDPLDSVDATGDADGDGVINLDEYLQGTDPNVDTVPPQFSGVDNITVDAVGYFTYVDLSNVKALDNLDGKSAAPDIDNVTGTTSLSKARLSLFRPGLTVITWTASDSNGNVAIVNQAINIRPLANLMPNQVAVEGGVVTIGVRLSGEAPAYPVTFDYTVSGTAGSTDHDAVDGSLSIASGTGGELVVNLVDDGVAEGSETLVITLSNPQNAALGNKTRQTVVINEGNMAPAITLTVAQAANAGPLVTQGGGTVTVTAVVSDLNAGDTFTYNWSQSSSFLMAINGTGGSASGTFEFDPSGLSAGVYPVVVSVTDSGSPAATTSARVTLNLKTSSPVLTAVDSDGDGVNDDVEGYQDADGNGVVDYLDPYSSASGINLIPNQTGQLQKTLLLQTDTGLKLRMGEAGLNADATGALVSRGNIETYVNQSGGSPNLTKDMYRNVGGIFDFEVYGLPVGETANVVIPLSSGILVDAVYRKFDLQNGWQMFIYNTNNSIHSARSVNGVCPAPGHASYTVGLAEFNDCIQLTIQDGGPNDADGVADGVILDPGGVAVADVTPEHVTPTPDDGSGGGGGSLHPVWLLLGLSGCLMLRRRKAGNRNRK